MKLSRRRLLSLAALYALPAAAGTPAPALTMLSAMAGAQFGEAARRHAAIGLRWLDLKDGLFGQNINELRLQDAGRVAAIAHQHGLRVWSLSTALCASDVAAGEAAFRARHEPVLEHVLRLAAILKPRSIRMIAASLQPYPGGEGAMQAVERDHGWVFAAYADMARRIAAAGCIPLIENETGPTIFARPDGIVRFFERLGEPSARLTWDVQNMWEAGVFPSLDVYRRLRPWIGCMHLKGGRAGPGGSTLAQASSLEQASWPVLAIVRAACDDGRVPVFSLNPSHGARPPGYDMWQTAQQDIAFLRQHTSVTE